MQQKCRSEQQSRVSYPYCKSSSVRPIQLEVNISIGRNRFVLHVEKCNNLHAQVQQFLKKHNINPKYETPIMAMVRKQLAKKQAQREEKDKCEAKSRIEQLKRVKSQVENKKKIHYQQDYQQQAEWQQQQHTLWHPQQNKRSVFSNDVRQNKQNFQSQFNSGNQQIDYESPGTHKLSKEQRIYTQEQEKCQNLYQKWKVKQKIKQTEKMKNNKDKSVKKQAEKQKQAQKSQHLSPCVSQKKVSTHSPDYFYNKGVRFNEAKEIHVEELYKQRYPFQLNRNSSLTPTKKNQLHERLFKEHRVKQMAKIEKQVSRVPVKIQPTIDKYKQKIIERDNKVNEALGYLLNHKLIQNPYKIQFVPKTPFRKTQAY